MEKMKKMANCEFLKSANAFSPKASARDCFSVEWFTGQDGMVSE